MVGQGLCKIDLSKEEWDHWRAHPLTIRIWASLEQCQQDIKDNLGWGLCLDGESVESTAINYATSVGIIQGLQELLGQRADEEETNSTGE